MKKTEKHQAICKELNKIYEAKNKDYGDSFGKQYQKYGIASSAIRIEDKFNRFDNIIQNGTKVKDETIEDTLLDMANYAIMTVMELRKQ